MKNLIPNLNIAVFNARSICNKTAGVFELLSDANINVCLLTETWLRKGDTSKISEIKELGFKIIPQSRKGRGGGVAIAYKKDLEFTRKPTRNFTSFELVESVLNSSSNELLRFCCVYRSCTVKLSKISDFCEEFDSYLDSLMHLPGKVVIAGDFNIHMEDKNNPDTKRFNQVIARYGLIQHISKATHICGGILDLVITRSNACDSLDISEMNVIKTPTTSDHFLVSFSCAFLHHKRSEKISKLGRKLNKIDIIPFKKDIIQSELTKTDKFMNCNTATELYNTVLRNLLDKHAPLTEFFISPYQERWVNTKCQEARRKRRKTERDHKRIQSKESKDAFTKAYKHAEAVINTTRDSYYEDRLHQSSDNKKDTYKIVNQLMDRDISKDIKPNHKADHVLCEEMGNYFLEKVETIYSNFHHKIGIISKNSSSANFQQIWQNFDPLENYQLDEILADLSKKECEEDPIPVKILMQCIEELKPIILFIVNDSLATGIFPSSLKNALVRPAVKNENGNANHYSNYRPISNLPFLSKIIEKSVHKQLDKYLQFHNMHAEQQSGYRSNYSCETATLAIYNDLLCLTDIKSKVVLLLLDLSAAFDTVNHSILLQKLENKFGLSGNVLKWFASYLTGRSFTVSIGKSRSRKCFLCIGVPQGSILGPILFILYTKELNCIAEKHGFSIHLYADDTQLYIEFNPLTQDMLSVEEKIINCLEDIKNWMTSNKLKINPDKTETLIAQARDNFSTRSVNSLRLSTDEEAIQPLPVVKSLGIRFDEHLTFEDHIDAIIQSCNIHLRNLRVIGSKLSYDLKRQLIHCLIFSKLDYCNGLLFGLPSFLIKKLQKVQNSSVRFLFGHKVIKKWDRVTPFLHKAHFLPVKQRIDFKIALTVFKCINNIAPSYLSKCISIRQQPIKTLRTDEDYFLLQVPPLPRLKQPERGLKYCGPIVWNHLPYELRTLSDVNCFKNKLKTYLFKKAFNDTD